MKAPRISGLVAITAVAMASGCATQGYSVIASTGTVIGVNIGEQPANGSVDATLGYKRAEFAFVPTNRSSGSGAGASGNGSRDTANVVMELHYTGMLSRSESAGIYQRLAVGDKAVAAPGAAVMFAKAPDGTLKPEALAAINAIPAAVPDIESDKAALATSYIAGKSDAATQAKYDKAAAGCGFTDFSGFIGKPGVSGDDVKCVHDKLVADGVTLSK